MRLILKYSLLVAGAMFAATMMTVSVQAGSVTTDDLENAADNEAEWLIYGRDYRNQRFSPLTDITPDNVEGLQPVWAFSTGGTFGGLEGTPLFHDGVLYVSADYARVFAIDARTGVMKWKYEPEYEPGLDAVVCCGPSNRGVALKDDFVYVETLDAHIVALNRADGSVAWRTKIDDWERGVTSTGAPLVVKDHVVVGTGGGEFGVRGYIKSYNAQTGELEWTTYTIPGPGEPGNETWPGDTWERGGGPTWVTGVYDPELDLLYWGAGNPAPWNSDLRPGDNLWSDSLLALNPDTGEIQWGFQFTPNDPFDYDGNAPAPVLVDVEVDGKSIKGAVQPNRNGFLYLLNRENGEFIYAVPTIDGINWTTGIDPDTGRATINEAMVPLTGGELKVPIIPNLEGGTNWFPPAYNPDLGYLFFSTNHWAMSLEALPEEDVIYNPGDWYGVHNFQAYRLGEDLGYIKAFDVAKKEFIWQVPSPQMLFAGLLATKSGLVFTGDELGFFMALDAESGEVLWKFQTGSGINASPMTYELDGTQYVAILSGMGGDPGYYYLVGPKGGMLWVFAVDGERGESSMNNVVPIEGAVPTFGE